MCQPVVINVGSSTAAYWFQFFLDAGIPPADAGNYAVTFTENRIKQDMIVDLTKEYLTELGVTVLGDMIAILKHAKRVHSQAARDKFLKDSSISSVAGATSSSTAVLPSPGPVKKVAIPVRPSRPAVDQPTVAVSKSLQASRPSKTSSGEHSDMLIKSREVDANTVVKKRPENKDTQQEFSRVVPAQGTMIHLRPHVVNEVPVSKVRTVTPEGGYNISCLSGEIRKARENTIRLKSDAKQSSVFDRLGEERALERPKQAEVFCRLGEKRELKRALTEPDEGCGAVSKRLKGAIDGPSKSNAVTKVSAGILSGGSEVESGPIHLRLGRKVDTSARSNGQTIQKISGPSKPSLQRNFSIGGGPSGALRQKITMATTARGVKGTELESKFSNDLIIQVQTNNLEGGRQFGQQQASKVHRSSAAGPPKSSDSVMQRLGPRKLEAQAVQSGSQKQPGNIVHRLGMQNSATRLRNLDGVNVSVIVASAKSGSKALSERWNAKPTQEVTGTGIFSRLGSKKS